MHQFPWNLPMLDRIACDLLCHILLRLLKECEKYVKPFAYALK